MARGAGLIAAGPERDDSVEAFVTQILIELFRGKLDRARIAEIPDYKQARFGHTKQAGRVGALAADQRLATATVVEDKLIDERCHARHGIAEEVLPDA